MGANVQDQELKPAVEVPVEKEIEPEMAKAANSLSEPAPSWFTPKRLLVIFCVINMVNYVDRGAIASNGVNGSPRACTKSGVCSHGSGIQGDFDLSNFKDGVISSAFMVGLLVASPIFASLAKSINPFRLIGVGLSVWTFAAAGCGISIDFWSITICRIWTESSGPYCYTGTCQTPHIAAGGIRCLLVVQLRFSFVGVGIHTA